MFRWTIVKASFKNPVIRISYAVVLGLPILIEILEASKQTVKIPSSVFEVFYSSLLLLISALLYTFTVPNEIRNYSDMHDYINKSRGDLLVAYPDRKKQVVMAHLDETQGELKSQVAMLDKTMREEPDPARKQNLGMQLDTLIEPHFPACVTRYLQKQWHRANTKKNWLALIVCTLLNIAAGLLALWVFYLRVKAVIHYSTSL